MLYASYRCKMSLSKALKRKIDSESRTYKEEWKQRYAFILPAFINAKPMCLICNEAVAVCKEYNIRRHHETKHGQFKNHWRRETGHFCFFAEDYAHSRANPDPTCASWRPARMFHLLFCPFTVIYTSINVSKLMGLLYASFSF